MIKTSLRLFLMRTIARSFFIRYMKLLKRHKSIDEQIDKLIEHGLIIKDKEKVAVWLSNINYYRFSGYLFGFKNRNKDGYEPDTTIEHIKEIYDFDRKFTRILMYALEDVELSLKTKLSYTLTKDNPDNPLIYLEPKIYNNENDFDKFKDKFNKAVKNNRSLPFVKHHIVNYDGKLPMWVAVELFTMGNIHAIYDNLVAKYRKNLAKQYNTGPNQLSSWIENLTYTRNHLAHYMRIYDFNFGRSPASCKKHYIPLEKTNKIFEQLCVISFMYSDKNEWNNYVLTEIEKLLNDYNGTVKLDKLGFPNNWHELLTIL